MHPEAFAPLIGLALVWVVVSDLLYRRISNWLVLALLMLWLSALGWQVLQGGGLVVAWRGVLAAGVVAVIGFALFVMRWVGAGDVKLIFVLCLLFGERAASFLLVTSLAGGMLVFSLPVLRLLELCLAHWVICGGRLLSSRWPACVVPQPVALSLSPSRGLPYGLAVAIGGWGVLFLL